MSAPRMPATELVEDRLCLGCWDTAREGDAFNYLLILNGRRVEGETSHLEGVLKGIQLSSLLNPGCYFCTMLGFASHT